MGNETGEGAATKCKCGETLIEGDNLCCCDWESVGGKCVIADGGRCFDCCDHSEESPRFVAMPLSDEVHAGLRGALVPAPAYKVCDTEADIAIAMCWTSTVADGIAALLNEYNDILGRQRARGATS